MLISLTPKFSGDLIYMGMAKCRGPQELFNFNFQLKFGIGVGRWG